EAEHGGTVVRAGHGAILSARSPTEGGLASVGPVRRPRRRTAGAGVRLVVFGVVDRLRRSASWRAAVTARAVLTSGPTGHPGAATAHQSRWAHGGRRRSRRGSATAGRMATTNPPSG